MNLDDKTKHLLVKGVVISMVLIAGAVAIFIIKIPVDEAGVPSFETLSCEEALSSARIAFDSDCNSQGLVGEKIIETSEELVEHLRYCHELGVSLGLVKGTFEGSLDEFTMVKDSEYLNKCRASN